MTDTIQEDVEIDAATGDGRVVSYYCSLVNSQNHLDDLIVPFYYEAAYPCHENPAATARDYVADALLVRAKREFLDDASFCTNPQRDPWFGRVSSLPEDELMDEASMSCSKLEINQYNEQMEALLEMGADPMQEEEECCVVVHGKMTFTKLASLENEDVMKTWVASQLNDITLAPPYRAAYLGSIMEAPPAEDNLEPAINDNDETTTKPEGDGNDDTGGGGGMTTPSSGADDLPDFIVDGDRNKPTSSARGGSAEEDPKFTYVGVLIVIGIVFAVVAVLYLVVRRRRYFVKGLDAQAAVMDSSDKTDDEQAAVAVVKEGTMSVEEDYMEGVEGIGSGGGGLGNVTIVPTHTSSSGGTTGGPVVQDAGFVEMLAAGDDFSASQEDVENAFPVNVMSNDDRSQMKIQSLAVKSFHTNEEDDVFIMDSASSPAAGGANQHLFNNALNHHNEKGGGGATQTTGSTSSGTYQFDLADANRSAIIGAYMGGGVTQGAAAASNGPPITMTVVPPYPMEETSESDIDSWAQTEGTVGSLEEVSRCSGAFEETGEI